MAFSSDISIFQKDIVSRSLNKDNTVKQSSMFDVRRQTKYKKKHFPLDSRGDFRPDVMQIPVCLLIYQIAALAESVTAAACYCHSKSKHHNTSVYCHRKEIYPQVLGNH